MVALELPMVVFTVLGQLAVGALVTAVVVDWLAGRSGPGAAAWRVLVAGWPVLVVGMIVSMFHMHDVTNVLNVLRNVGTSWLSREIWFALGLAGLWRVCLLLAKFAPESRRLLLALEAVTVVAGLGLVLCQAAIYTSVATVPGWHTGWVTWQFFAVALALGPVFAVVVWALWWPEEQAAIVRRASRLAGLAAAAGCIALVVSYPAYLVYLQGAGAAGQSSAQAVADAGLPVVVGLLVIGAVLAALVVAAKLTGDNHEARLRLQVTGGAALIVVLVGCLVARNLHYAAMVTVGL
jgi:anaerobic dimethyl sulfoxide reductase subunit C (anchor subunit)